MCSYKGTQSLLPSDFTLVLQYGSGPSSDFLAKILDVNTPLFLYNAQFYLSYSSLLHCKSHKSRHPQVLHGSTAGSMFAYVAGNVSSIPKYVPFFNHYVCNGFQDCKIPFFFALIFVLFPIFTFKNERSAVDFSILKVSHVLLS
jgi:hypothetical protein